MNSGRTSYIKYFSILIYLDRNHHLIVKICNRDLIRNGERNLLHDLIV